VLVNEQLDHTAYTRDETDRSCLISWSQIDKFVKPKAVQFAYVTTAEMHTDLRRSPTPHPLPIDNRKASDAAHWCDDLT